MQVISRIIPSFRKVFLWKNVEYFPKLKKNDSRFCIFTSCNFTNTFKTQSLHQNAALPTIIQLTTDVGLNPEDVQRAVSESPELLNASANQWETGFCVLSNYGFSYQDILNMFRKYPLLLLTNKDKLTKSLMLWQTSELGDENIIQLLKRNPYFLFINERKIEKQLPLLKSLTSSKKLTTLLKNCPDLLFQKWVDIQAKLNYLKSVMKFEEVEIVKSTALSYTTFELMARHVFLERCGRFIPVNPKALPDEPNSNPKLNQITDTSDEHFATHIAGLSLEEFEVFKELFFEERQLIDEEFHNSDSDSD